MELAVTIETKVFGHLSMYFTLSRLGIALLHGVIVSQSP